jgi:hypothetical protein
MAIYSLALNTTVTTTGAAAWDVKAAATNRPAVMEVSIQLGAATASTYGLGRAGNTPTQTSPTLVQAEDPGDPAGVSGRGRSPRRCRRRSSGALRFLQPSARV